MVQVNHAVAMAETGLMAAALATPEGLQAQMENFQPFQAAPAAVLARAGQTQAARSFFEKAMALSDKESNRLFLAGRMQRLADGAPDA